MDIYLGWALGSMTTGVVLLAIALLDRGLPPETSARYRKWGRRAFYLGLAWPAVLVWATVRYIKTSPRGDDDD